MSFTFEERREPWQIPGCGITLRRYEYKEDPGVVKHTEANVVLDQIAEPNVIHTERRRSFNEQPDFADPGSLQLNFGRCQRNDMEASLSAPSQAPLKNHKYDYRVSYVSKDLHCTKNVQNQILSDKTQMQQKSDLYNTSCRYMTSSSIPKTDNHSFQDGDQSKQLACYSSLGQEDLKTQRLPPQNVVLESSTNRERHSSSHEKQYSKLYAGPRSPNLTYRRSAKISNIKVLTVTDINLDTAWNPYQERNDKKEELNRVSPNQDHSEEKAHTDFPIESFSLFNKESKRQGKSQNTYKPKQHIDTLESSPSFFIHKGQNFNNSVKSGSPSQMTSKYSTSPRYFQSTLSQSVSQNPSLHFPRAADPTFCYKMQPPNPYVYLSDEIGKKHQNVSTKGNRGEQHIPRDAEMPQRVLLNSSCSTSENVQNPVDIDSNSRFVYIPQRVNVGLNHHSSETTGQSSMVASYPSSYVSRATSDDLKQREEAYSTQPKYMGKSTQVQMCRENHSFYSSDSGRYRASTIPDSRVTSQLVDNRTPSFETGRSRSKSQPNPYYGSSNTFPQKKPGNISPHKPQKSTLEVHRNNSIRRSDSDPNIAMSLQIGQQRLQHRHGQENFTYLPPEEASVFNLKKPKINIELNHKVGGRFSSPTIQSLRSSVVAWLPGSGARRGNIEALSDGLLQRRKSMQKKKLNWRGDNEMCEYALFRAEEAPQQISWRAKCLPASSYEIKERKSDGAVPILREHISEYKSKRGWWANLWARKREGPNRKGKYDVGTSVGRNTILNSGALLTIEGANERWWQHTGYIASTTGSQDTRNYSGLRRSHSLPNMNP